MAIWTPNLSGRGGPKYLRIVEALADDIARGLLTPGTRLPPHRDLAYRLGVSPNTTARAYAEGVARALIQGEVGRGTYVRAPATPAPHTTAATLDRPAKGPVDLSRNLPWPGPAGACLADTLAVLGRRGDLPDLANHQSGGAPAHHADAAIGWLRRSDVIATRDEVVITNGVQHGLLCALLAVTRPGDLLLTEPLSYAPVRALADRLGLSLRTVPRDEGGLCPDALARLCRDHAPTALYLTPTLHTPTTTTLDDARRDAIAAVARKHGITIIEDDVFGCLAPEAPVPIAARAPKNVLYLSSTSKGLAPGLRVGFVRAPADRAAAIRGAVTLSTWMVPPLMAEVAALWIADGTADRLIGLQRKEAARRTALARRLLDGQRLHGGDSGLHLWLTLPRPWTADDFRTEAARRGVLVVEASAFAMDGAPAPEAVRLCLSHEADSERLHHGLTVLRDILRGPAAPSRMVL